RRGHQIAIHGFHHIAFTDLRHAGLMYQLETANTTIGGQSTKKRWVRPPHGRLDARVLLTLLSRGWLIALWSYDSLDYELHDAEKVVERCAPENVGPGEVILFHEGQQWTVEALPRIVASLRAAGYEFVTMADMFGA